MKSFNLSPLARGLGVLFTATLLSHHAHAQSEDTSVTHLGVLTITASADASRTGLLGEYAGGQVANGGRMGFLGNKTTLTNPFSTTVYTNEYITNQQADSVGDVLKKDASVQLARGFGNFQESYIIRGFVTNSDDTMMNGLYGIMPRQHIASDLFERVEIQRGAGTFLNGMAPAGSNKGGTINLLPKRAGNTPTYKATFSTHNGENAKISLDLGQRFLGDRLGVRTTLAHQDGNTVIDKEKEQLSLVGVGLDYQGGNYRLSADLGYQDNQLNATRTNVSVSGDGIPDAPKAKSNWAQDWTYSNEKDIFGTLRGEYDLTDRLAFYGAYGFRHGEEANSLANLSVHNTNGDGTQYRFDNTREDKVNTAEIGVRGQLATGAIKHEWAVSANHFNLEKKNAYVMDFFNSRNTNLYNPTAYPTFALSSPFNGFQGGDLAAPNLNGETTLQSFAVGDTLLMLDNKVQATIGLRHQKVIDKSYAYGTSALLSEYNQSKTTPAFGLVYRHTGNLSFYGNYAQSLSKGETAPTTAGNQAVTNAGQVMKPAITDQSELGVKYENGDIGAGLALFRSNKPRYRVDDSRSFTEAGENIHQGAELSVYGEPKEGLRVLGGVSFYDTEQKGTGNASTEGKSVIGVAKSKYNLGVEYDVPQLSGLTVTGDLTHVGSRYANAQNTQKVPSYTTLDLGARYRTLLGGKDVTFTGQLINLTGENYWASVGGYEDAQGENGAGYLNAGEPRSLKVSATLAF